MENSKLVESQSEQWYASHRKMCGVFEGGGAKGVLYPGALRAVDEDRIWFDAVAGSSAGALTAALVAAGYRPAELEELANESLELLSRARLVNCVRRMRAGSGILDHKRFRSWLAEKLREKAGGDEEKGPTFEELHEASGIELFVAAADLRYRSLFVFGSTTTPNQPVAEAVLASATIPFAFEPVVVRGMGASDSDKTAPHLMADGGLAANFPLLVFTDDAFRKYSKLGPSSQREVIGFVLDDPEDEMRPDYSTIETVGTWLENAKERAPRHKPVTRGGRMSWVVRPVRAVVRLVADVVARILLVITWLLKGEDDPQEFWIWDPLQDRVKDRWATLARRALTTGGPVFVAGIIGYLIALVVGFAFVGGRTVDWFWNQAEGISSWGAWVLFVVVAIVAVGAALGTILVAVLGLVGAIVARVAYRTVGRYGKGYSRTLLNAPAPPPWIEDSEARIIRLKVPRGITTLGIDPKVDIADCQREAARQAAEALAADRVPDRRGQGS